MDMPPCCKRAGYFGLLKEGRDHCANGGDYFELHEGGTYFELRKGEGDFSYFVLLAFPNSHPLQDKIYIYIYILLGTNE